MRKKRRQILRSISLVPLVALPGCSVDSDDSGSAGETVETPSRRVVTSTAEPSHLDVPEVIDQRLELVITEPEPGTKQVTVRALVVHDGTAEDLPEPTSMDIEVHVPDVQEERQVIDDVEWAIQRTATFELVPGDESTGVVGVSTKFSNGGYVSTIDFFDLHTIG